MGAARESRHKLADEIVGRLTRRHSTAVVLFHHVVAERLGLGPTDHKCLDLVRERGAMAGSDLFIAPPGAPGRWELRQGSGRTQRLD
jgi:hypothetical protein